MKRTSMRRMKKDKKQINKCAEMINCAATAGVPSKGKSVLTEQDEQLIAQFNLDNVEPRKKKRSVPTVENSPSIATLDLLSELEKETMRVAFTGQKTQNSKSLEHAVNTVQQG